jgi:hypothetical protein
MNLTEFRDELTISGPFEAFCQPGYIPKDREVVRLEECEFCHSRYNPYNLNRKRKHESRACQS